MDELYEGTSGKKGDRSSLPKETQKAYMASETLSTYRLNDDLKDTPSSSQKQRDDEIVETVWDTAEHVRPWLPWCGKAIQVSAITVPVSLGEDDLKKVSPSVISRKTHFVIVDAVGVTKSIKTEVLDILRTEKPMLAPLSVWQAYELVEGKKAGTPISELTALVSLIRKVVGLDQELTPYERTVNRNFQQWVFQKQAGALKFNPEQMEWLRMVKDHMISSFHIERDDLDYAPFDAQGGLAKMYQLFGDEMDGIIDEMNEALAA